MSTTNSGQMIRLAGLTPESVVDGLGLRFVVWAQGCRHRCPHCHSPFTWDFDRGRLCRVDDLLAEIARNPLLRGVTFSGGDPVEQAGAFACLARLVRKMGLDIWCYTGYTWEQLLAMSQDSEQVRDLLHCTDVLVDGRYDHSQRDTTLAFRGSGNQRLIDVPASLQQKKVVPFSRE